MGRRILIDMHASSEVKNQIKILIYSILYNTVCLVYIRCVKKVKSDMNGEITRILKHMDKMFWKSCSLVKLVLFIVAVSTVN